MFWGLDALPMLRACLDGDAWFACGAWEAVRAIPTGVSRKRTDFSPDAGTLPAPWFTASVAYGCKAAYIRARENVVRMERTPN